MSRRSRNKRKSLKVSAFLLPCVLLLVMGILTFLIKPSTVYNATHNFDNTITNKNQLIPDRQIVAIQLDSFLLLTEQLKQSYNQVFQVEIGKEVTIKNIGKEKIFNDIFLDRKNLGGFAKLENNPLTTSEKYGFSVPVKKKGALTYIELPVEIVQSMVLHIK